MFRSTSVVLLSDPRMLLVSMANSDWISKRPLSPAATGRPAGTCAASRTGKLRRGAPGELAGQGSAVDVPHGPWRDCTRLAIAGGQAHVVGSSGWPVGSSRAARAMRSDTCSAPAVGRPGGVDQRLAQLAEFGGLGALLECGGDVLGRTSHLVDAIREVGRVVGRQHHRIVGHRRSAVPVQRGPLFVGPLPARLPAVLAATAHSHVGDVSTAPAAGLRVGATAHACRL